MVVLHYLQPGATVEMKSKLCEIVRQMACLLGNFPYRINQEAEVVNFPYVGRDLSTLYPTCIYSDGFGREFNRFDRAQALNTLMALFPLTSILNESIVKECPDHPIPEKVKDRFQGHKVWNIFKWEEEGIPLKSLHAVPTSISFLQKLPATAALLAQPYQAPAPIETEILIRLPHVLARGHSLSICGNGAGLDWDHRAPLFKIDDLTYVYRFTGSAGNCEYKILCDGTWETGGNHLVEAGKKTEIIPNLSLPKPTTGITVNGGPSDNMTIRGQGIKALSWEKGQPMTYAMGRWTFVTDEPCEIFEFKILKNGVWQQGDNGIAVFNEETEINPKF